MKLNQYKIFFLLILIGSYVQSELNAQQSILAKDPSIIGAAGGIHKAANLSLEWTLGEVFVQTGHTGERMVTEGYHQANLFVKSTNAKSMADKYQVQIAPNPTTGLLKVSIKTTEKSSLFIHVLDLAGKILLTQKVSAGNQDFQFYLNDMAEGMYLLSMVNDQGYQVQTFKVIKQ